MKLYEITIKPKSAFGTDLKGDTIFGHFCWQAAHDDSLVDGGLKKNLFGYGETPFAVFSSAFPKNVVDKKTVYYLPKPEHPFFMGSSGITSTKKKLEDRKEQKMKKWLRLGNQDLMISPNEKCLSEEEIIKELALVLDPDRLLMVEKAGYKNLRVVFSQAHNSINRLTQTTGKGDFAPYSTENFFFYPDMVLALFVLLDERVTNIERIVKGLNTMGQSGFGRDASTGLGKFEACEADEITADYENADACYSLAPCVPQKGEFSQSFFSPFVRYGKHGDMLARSENPFKRPVIMANEGAVFFPNDKAALERPWIGSAVRNVSFLKPETVCQGYAPWLPVKLEASK